jgi:hypothetical protein
MFGILGLAPLFVLFYFATVRWLIKVEGIYDTISLYSLFSEDGPT